jgi:hypothetical protein
VAKGKKGLALKLLIGLVGLAVAAVLGVAVWAAAQDTPRPSAEPSPAADALAREMLAALDADAWAATGAAQWTFFDGTQHLWDRRRNLARVTTGDSTVLLNVNTREGVVVEGPADDPDAAVAHAYARWANDSFWLAAPFKVFDPGTERALVTTDDGEQGLLVSYSSGGVTPGDAYLWLLDGDKRPRAWRMWVSNLPIGGLEVGWGPFRQTASGAWLTDTHDGPITLELTGMKTAKSLDELTGGEDPFAPLLATK